MVNFVSQTIRLPGDRIARLALADGPDDLPRAVRSLGIRAGRPVVAVVGGAGGLGPELLEQLATVFTSVIGPVIRERDAAAVDGGTDSGVMRLLGLARAAGDPFPLIGVAARETVDYPGHHGSNADSSPLEPHHSHFVLVPGAEWGDEASSLAEVASLVAGGGPSATVLVNGGGISLTDAERSVAEGRPVVVLGGTGRSADRIAAASFSASGHDDQVAALARNPLVQVVDVFDPGAAATALREALKPR